MQSGMRNLLTDVPGLRVGNAGDVLAKSGVTVVTADKPFVAGVQVMGGAPGTRETDLLAPDKSVSDIDAIVLSGGSAFGLAAAQGVQDALAESGRGLEVGPVRVPIVPAAIIFDLLAGGSGERPDYPALGRAAFAEAGDHFALGSAGAGIGATVAGLKGGLGSASVRVGDATVAALVVVNALGSPVAGESGRFWAAPWELDGEFGGLGVEPAPSPDWPNTKLGPLGNTTIAVVATDARLDKAGCTRMATAAHDGMARALVPSHTPMDGDLVFALSTGAVEADPLRLGHAAAVCLSRAIARGVYEASAADGDPLPTWRDRFGASGR
ncbi:P1 family peptidase [Pelagovum pacificum]|uniref:P1 family peptidase n=1 Tax=Pelagovum pacificum TaxID=2588711 RepID=A0A5C5G984_9RHOB|nr:P1 family peptidase [Pelagovum pacificum]QQA42202.1 P1 family peptidase [Pelagovum pacificum]TNY31288.1 P1 family peptidase [Pelagovum pacificum]